MCVRASALADGALRTVRLCWLWPDAPAPLQRWLGLYRHKTCPEGVSLCCSESFTGYRGLATLGVSCEITVIFVLSHFSAFSEKQVLCRLVAL